MIFSFKEKLKLFRGALRNWNVKVFSFLNLEVDEAIKELNNLDVLASEGSSLNLNDLSLKRSLRSSKVWDTISFKESILYQKARALWL